MLLLIGKETNEGLPRNAWGEVRALSVRRNDNDVRGFLGQADVREDEERDQEKLEGKNPALPGPLASKRDPDCRGAEIGPGISKMTIGLPSHNLQSLRFTPPLKCREMTSSEISERRDSEQLPGG